MSAGPHVRRTDHRPGRRKACTRIAKHVAQAVLAGTLAALATAGTASAAGELDVEFSGDGWLRTLEVRTETNNYLPEGVEDLALQEDGKIVVVGELQDGASHWYFGVFRYTPSGELDTSFGHGGWAHTNLGSFDFAHAVAVQEDGKIVVGGESECRHALCFTVARYTPAGALDTTFGGGDGVVRTMFGECGCRVNDLAIQPNGKIVAVGWRFRYGDAQDDALFAVARYRSDGRLDPTFSGDGRASLDFGYGDDVAEAVAVQPDGKIVVAGSGTRNLYLTDDDFAFARFRADGSLDRTFSTDGLRTVHFGGERSEGAYGIDLQSDGRILAVGASGPAPRMAVTRLTAGGALDASFGRRLTRPGTYGGYATAVLEHPDGGIVVTGRAFEDSNHGASDWVVVRYGRGGSLDETWGQGGIARTDYGTGEDSANAVAVQDDGKIVVGGSIYASQGLARYRVS